jgi:hypothetical protein
MNARTFISVDKAAFYLFIVTEPEGHYEFERGRIVQQMVLPTLLACIVAGQDEAACLTWVRAADGPFPASPPEFGLADNVGVPPTVELDI